MLTSARLFLLGSLLLGCTDADSELLAENQIEQALTGYQVVSSETTVDTAASKFITVPCPAGTKALGAGWAALDSTGVIRNRFNASYFEPSFNGASWTAIARLTSGAAPTTWKLRVSVLCSTTTALAGYEVHVAETAVTTVTTKDLDHQCPSGKRAVGAGWSALDSTSAILEGDATYFEPGFSGASWLVRVRNLSTFSPSWKLRTRLICVNQAALPGYEIVVTETAASGLFSKQVISACPAGKKATGAGWATLDSTSAILDGAATYSMPAFNGVSWMSNGQVVAPSWKLRSSVICTL
jgi:hypothetical protein